MKYAFIMNSAGLDPDSYSVKYNDGENEYYFAAVHGMEMACGLAKNLADENYEMIDLCGDYDAEKATKIAEAAEGKIKVNYAKYNEKNQAKFGQLESAGKYGIIVLGFDLTEESVELELLSEEYNTYISIVSDEEMAKKQAKKMVSSGIDFIELCGYFDYEKSEKVEMAIGEKVPLGYCG